MNRKELTKTFMTVSKWKNSSGLYGFYEKNSALYGLKILKRFMLYCHFMIFIFRYVDSYSDSWVKWIKCRQICQYLLVFVPWHQIIIRLPVKQLRHYQDPGILYTSSVICHLMWIYSNLTVSILPQMVSKYRPTDTRVIIINGLRCKI